MERKPGAGRLTSPIAGASPSKDPVGAGKHTLVAAVPPAPAASHAAAAQRVAERDGEGLNAMIKIVAYDARGKVISTWGARSHWDGPLPQRFHGQLAGSKWTWDNPDAASVRLAAKADGTGGVSVERWAAGVHAARIDVMAEDADEVATRNDRRYGDARDASEPGLGEDEHNAHASPDGGAGATDGASEKPGAGNTPTARAGAIAGPAPGAYTDPHGVAGGTGTHAATSGATSGVGGSGGSTGTATNGSGGGHGSQDARTNKDETGADAKEPDQVDEPASKYERELDEALGDEEQEKEGEPETDEPSDGGNGYAGGAPDGRTGRDAATDGHGPGGKRARHDGDGTGADVAEGNRNGTKFGSRGGSERDGAHHGMAGGEGKPGDRGVPSGIGLWSVIPVPARLRGAVEVGMIVTAGDVGGDIGGLGGALFRRGLRGPVAIVRRMVAVEAREAARLQMRAVLDTLHASPQFMSLTHAEKSAVVRILYWDKQRGFFRGYLSAAREQEAAALKAVAKAKPAARPALKARAAAGKEGEQVALAEPIAGRLPVNHTYAGGEFPRSVLPRRFRDQGLKIKPSGHPDFEPFAMKLPNGKKEVTITFSGSYKEDVKLANAKAGLEKAPPDWTWHHVEDGQTMQLVPDDLHEAVGHSGGVAEYKHAHGVNYGD